MYNKKKYLDFLISTGKWIKNYKLSLIFLIIFSISTIFLYCLIEISSLIQFCTVAIVIILFFLEKNWENSQEKKKLKIIFNLIDDILDHLYTNKDNCLIVQDETQYKLNILYRWYGNLLPKIQCFFTLSLDHFILHTSKNRYKIGITGIIILTEDNIEVSIIDNKDKIKKLKKELRKNI